MRQSNNKLPKATKILMVEGDNDRHVVWALARKHEKVLPKGLFEVWPAGSDKQLLEAISPIITSTPEKSHIGIVVDADDNLSARWQSIANKLKREGYDVPKEPSEKGTFVTAEDLPSIGIWLMPDNDTNGMLEDFCHRLIEPENLEVAEQSVEQAKTQNVTSFKDAHRSKAIIHTYLAWQHEPGLPLGAAITAKALDGDKPLAKTFVTFLTDLFVE